MMRTLLSILTVAAVLACVAGLGSGASAAGKPRIVLAPIVDTSIPEPGKMKAEGIAEAIRTGLTEALFKSGKFVLVADTDLARDLDAQRYQQYLSGDFNPATAAEIGQKVGAQSLVRCTVVRNQFSRKESGFGPFKQTEFVMSLEVAVEICDIEKAIICFMDKSSTDQKTKSQGLDLGTAGKPQPPISLANPKDVRVMAINQVVAELAGKILQNAARQKGKGTVTSVKGDGRANDVIIVNLGSSAGAAQDVELAIVALDEDGFEETVGKARVTAVQDDKSKAVVVEAKRPVVAGDMVQIGGGSAAADGGPKTNGSTTMGSAKQRVMVVVPEYHLRLIVPDPAGETQIIKSLIDKNYVVVDQKVAKEIVDNESLRAKLKGDAEEVVRMLADRTEAEIIIYGEAFSEGAQRITTNAGTAFRCGARIEVRAVQRDSGRILYADSAQAVAVDAAEALAGKRALKMAADLLCNGHEGTGGFVDMLTARLANPVQLVECVVKGVEDEDALKDVESGLKSACGGTVHRYSYRDGVAKFNFESNRSSQELTDAISGVSMQGKFKLAGTTPNKIELEYVR